MAHANIDLPALEKLLVGYSDALGLAMLAHDGQVRRTPQGTVSYILHPIRVHLRLVSWGVTDEATLTAALLHDAVEDGADRFGRPGPTDIRESAFEMLAAQFGTVVADTVRGLTNPVDGDYLVHVKDAVREPRVLVVKTSDFWDNALMLAPHQTKLRAKYAPLYPVLAAALSSSQEAQMLLPVWKQVLAALERPVHQ